MKLDNKKSTIIFSSIILVAIIFINLIARNWFVRFDLTDNQMYSLSESSISVIKKMILARGEPKTGHVFDEEILIAKKLRSHIKIDN